MLERDTLRAILLRYGTDPRVWVWRNATGNLPWGDGRRLSYGLIGSADILGALVGSGRMVAIEVKSPTGRLRPEQEAFKRVFTAAGGLYCLARSVADVENAIVLALAPGAC